MDIHKELLRLQWLQLKHDQNYHKDIVLLPIPERIKHMALHCAKYVSYFFQAEENSDTERLKQVLVDAYIISLATANALNQDLGGDIAVDFEDADTLSALGLSIGKNLTRTNDLLWFIRNYAHYTGQLAKLCESWDHMENLTFRSGMKDSNLSLFKLVLAEASRIEFDLEAAYTGRMRIVESRSMFDEFFQQQKDM